jgi:CRP-like cAMP-binding protein
MRLMPTMLEIIKGNPLFEGFSAAALELFAGLGQARTYASGDVVFKEMSSGDEIFLILEGRASVKCSGVRADQPLVEIIVAGPGDILGEISFIEDGPRSASVVADTPLVTHVWKAADWRALCEHHPEIGYRLVMGISRLLCARVRRSNIQVALLNKILLGGSA